MVSNNIITKQGTFGIAFYIILSGVVDIYVNNSPDKASVFSPSASVTSENIESLGERVNQLKEGDVFGDRALESQSSLRMATVVSNDLCHLIIISKQDYMSLVSIIMQSDILEKVNVLRKTTLFQNVDGNHLREVAKYLLPRRHQIEEVIYKIGDKVNEMFVISCGECRAEIEFQTLDKTSHSSQIVDVGRIAPFSVLGTKLALIESILDEIFANETVTSSTLVSSFSISKYDYLFNLQADTRAVISQIIRQFDQQKPLIPELWESTPKLLTEDDVKIKNTWSKFRNDILERDKHSDILKTYRYCGLMFSKSTSFIDTDIT